MNPRPDPDSKDPSARDFPAKTGSAGSPGSPKTPVVRIPAAPSNEEGIEVAKAGSIPGRAASQNSAGQATATRPSSSENAAVPGSPVQSAPNIKISRPDEFAGSTMATPPVGPGAQSAGGKPKAGGLPLAPQPRSAKSAWMVRAVILLSVAGCLALVYWSVFLRLLPVTKEHQEKALEMTRTADDLERLRARWTAQQIAEIKEQYARAQESLFQREEDLAAWEEEIRNEASMRVLAATTKRQPAMQVTNTVAGISQITAQVNVVPEDIFGSTNAPYNRLLLFADALARSPKRLDLIDLSVVGNSNSISQAQAVVQLFSTEGKPL